MRTEPGPGGSALDACPARLALAVGNHSGRIARPYILPNLMTDVTVTANESDHVQRTAARKKASAASSFLAHDAGREIGRGDGAGAGGPVDPGLDLPPVRFPKRPPDSRGLADPHRDRNRVGDSDSGRALLGHAALEPGDRG